MTTIEFDNVISKLEEPYLPIPFVNDTYFAKDVTEK